MNVKRAVNVRKATPLPMITEAEAEAEAKAKAKANTRRTLIREMKREEGKRGYRDLARLRASCGDVMFYSQTDSPTCWFASVINATLYSENLRKVIIAKLREKKKKKTNNTSESDDWRPLEHAADPLIKSHDEDARERFLLALHLMLSRQYRLTSNNRAEWLVHAFRPRFLISLLNKISPRSFPIKPNDEGEFRKTCGKQGEGYNPLTFTNNFMKLLGIGHDDVRILSSAGISLRQSNAEARKIPGQKEAMDRQAAADVIDRLHKAASYSDETAAAGRRQEQQRQTVPQQEGEGWSPRRHEPPMFKSETDGGNKYFLDAFVAIGGPTPKQKHALAGVTCRGRKYIVDSSRWTIPNPTPLHTSLWRSDKSRKYSKENTIFLFYNATRYGNLTSEHVLPGTSSAVFENKLRVTNDDIQTIRYSPKGLQPAHEVNRAPL